MNQNHTKLDSNTTDELVLNSRLSILRCPACFQNLVFNNSGLRCIACVWESQRKLGQAHNLTKSASSDKSKIATFWGDTYKQWYGERDNELSIGSLTKQMKDVGDFLKVREHVAAIEMGRIDLAGKRVLEIGSGAGGYAAFFRSRGASMTCCDITPERASATQQKMELLSGVYSGDGVAMVADAENLPFHDATFDLVFSNGVLHHTNDTVRALAVLFRVIRPGGQAVLMLYSRHSAYFWTSLVPRGLFSGRIFFMPEANWIGWFTEGRPKFAGQRNPITRVYSHFEIHKLLENFGIRSTRKSSFMFWHLGIPKVYVLRNWILRLLKVPKHKGALLTHDQEMYVETPLELALGSYLGFAWNIVATKPEK